MLYKSTRTNKKAEFSSAYVIKNGLATDGGLYVPEAIPNITFKDIELLCKKDYPNRAADILSKFLTDYSYDELFEDCQASYSDVKFPGGAAPLQFPADNQAILELWHGPTAAFKDMALQIMPRLLSRALEKTGEKRTAYILVATSGDTGKAALEGYCDVANTKITVFYPVDGVSKVQKLQMATQTGNNVSVCAIKGNFDDAQSGVKNIFGNKEVADELNKSGHFFSSANSINWGRLAPQIVYYVSAYCDLVNSNKIKIGDIVNICVPTGNFGNILAAYIAKLAGLPFGKLICASNSNNVLTDFLTNGTYDRNREFHITMSPSMDILISSNLERLLYFVGGADLTSKYMSELKANGKYTVADDIFKKIQESFVGYYADESETAQTIKKMYENHKYLCDTHTAVAISCADKYMQETGDNTLIITASTASPYKFARDVYKSLTNSLPTGDLEALDELNTLTGEQIPYPLVDIDKRLVRFENVIDIDDMISEVLKSI